MTSSSRYVQALESMGITDEDKKSLFLRGFGKNTGLWLLFLSQEILAITGITITEPVYREKAPGSRCWYRKGHSGL